MPDSTCSQPRSSWTSRSVACARPRRVTAQCAGSNQDLELFLCEAGTSSCGALLLSVTESGTRRLPPRPSTARSVGVATVNTAQRNVRKQHRGRFYGELHAPDQVLRCEGSPRGKEDTEVSKTIGIRCTHGETNACTRSYAAARKDYCALESGQQVLQEGQGARDLRQKDAHVQPIPAGKQVKSADWHWGT